MGRGSIWGGGENHFREKKFIGFCDWEQKEKKIMKIKTEITPRSWLHVKQERLCLLWDFKLREELAGAVLAEQGPSLIS